MEAAVAGAFHALGNGDGGQGGTVLKSVPADGFQVRRQLDAGHCGATIKSRLADGGNGIGDFDALECRTLPECVFTNFSQTVGQVDFLQTGAGAKRIVTDAGDAVAHGNIRQIHTAIKGVSANFGDRIRNDDFFNAVASVQHGFGNDLHAVFENDFLELIAVMEAAVAGTFHTLGNGDGGQGLTVLEGIRADGLQIFGQLDADQRSTIFKGTVADGGDGIGNGDGGQRLAIAECAICDGGQAIGQIDVFQIVAVPECGIADEFDGIGNGDADQMTVVGKCAVFNTDHIVAVQGLGHIEAAGVAAVLGDDSVVIVIHIVFVQGDAAAAGAGAVDDAAQVEFVPAADPAVAGAVTVAAFQSGDAVLIVMMDLGGIAFLENVVMLALGILPDNQIGIGINIHLGIGEGYDVQAVPFSSLDRSDPGLGADFQIGVGLDGVDIHGSLQLDAGLHSGFGDQREVGAMELGQAAQAAVFRELNTHGEIAGDHHGISAVHLEHGVNTSFADAVVQNAQLDALVHTGQIQPVGFCSGGEVSIAIQTEHGVQVVAHGYLELGLHIGQGHHAGDVHITQRKINGDMEVGDLLAAGKGIVPAFRLGAVFKDIDGLNAFFGNEIGQIHFAFTLDIHGEHNIFQGHVHGIHDHGIAAGAHGLDLIGIGNVHQIDHEHIAGSQGLAAADDGHLIITGQINPVAVTDLLDTVDKGVAVGVIFLQRRPAKNLGNGFQNGGHFCLGHGLLGQEGIAHQSKPALVDRDLNVIGVGDRSGFRVCIPCILRQLEHQRCVECMGHKFAGGRAVGIKGQTHFCVDQTEFHCDDHISVKIVFTGNVREVMIRTGVGFHFHGAGVDQCLNPLHTGDVRAFCHGLRWDDAQAENQNQKDCYGSFHHIF